MKNLKNITALSFCSLLAFTSATVLAGPQVAPFTDNLTINTSNLPTGGVVVSYQPDTTDSINITGPQTVAAGVTNFMVHISSTQWSNGYPAMTFHFPVTGKTCTLTFIDGALVSELDYKDGAPPSCDDFQVGNIVQDGQYAYHLNVSYLNNA